jgi:predicted DNA-binding protein
VKRTTIFLTEQMIPKLPSRSDQTGLTMADLIRRAIEAFLKKEQK